MVNDNRPDPDQLLKVISNQAASTPTGKLSIFFGMSAGVGKTYAMLTAARAQLTAGVDVVIGLVETHGRKETEALTAGLEIIPRANISYRDLVLTEMDLNGILARKPQLVLVDELAHTNVPGSRHPKRWQDVLELIGAGIDVYTTLNVQHVESRKDQVEAIGGITMRETVPDAILELASAIELVDITPAELLKRLEEGKVYLGERAETAAANFFKEDRLTALRELALRLTAEKVDHDLQDMITAGGGDQSWKSAERLMVAVSHSPHSGGLVRATRRLAFGLGAPWLAVHVDNGEPLSPEDRATLARNLKLVQELGGELVATDDTDISGALERVARQRRVTQLVVGRPVRKWRDFWIGGSILDRLARKQTSYDILVLRPDRDSIRPNDRKRAERTGRPELRPYAITLAVVAAVALANAVLLPMIGYKAVGFLFLLSVLVVSMFVSFGAVILAAILSALVWDYFFIPPFGTLYIHQSEDVMMVCSYFVAALVTGTLAQRIQSRQRLVRQREERTNLLFELAKSLVGGNSIRDAIDSLSFSLQPLLRGQIEIVQISPQSGELRDTSVRSQAWIQTERELAVARWAHEHGKVAGWSTDTLGSSVARYTPLRAGSNQPLGVLAFKPDRDRKLTQDEENLLSAIAYQLALFLERELLQAQAQDAQKLRESEQLLQAVMDSVSHELRTPLTAIAGTASALSTHDSGVDPARRQQLVSDLLTMTERLNRVVGNLLDMSRLSSGVMTLRKDWHDPLDLISVSLSNTQREMSGHEVRMVTDESLPLIMVDFQFMTQAVSNILSNAATYAPRGTPIEIGCRCDDAGLNITISDYGPGIPESELPKIFAKFYRMPGSPSGGVGLGLAITKVIIEAHSGKLTAMNRRTGGACFEISLPVETQPEIPTEPEAS
jgi:two-component system, OmpR family, sensor histidine kinase KdpD